MDRRLFVPAVYQPPIRVQQFSEQRGRVIGHARLEHQLRVLPHQVDRVVLDAADVADKVEDAGLAAQASRRPEALMCQQEAPGLCAAQVQDWGWESDFGHVR